MSLSITKPIPVAVMKAPSNGGRACSKALAVGFNDWNGPAE